MGYPTLFGIAIVILCALAGALYKVFIGVRTKKYQEADEHSFVENTQT